jgi:tetratricopeptide (TPR) repeat protein
VASVWSPAAHERVNQALTRAGGGYGHAIAERVVAKLDDYGRGWSAAYSQVSEATLLRGEQSPAILERRLQCLERERQEFEALVDLLAAADGVVSQHAIEASYHLPLPASCATADASRIAELPSAPAMRARVYAAQRQLARAAALSSAGQDQAAIGLVERTLIDVRALPHRRTEADLLLLSASCKHHLGDNTGALTAFQDAFVAAQAAADDAAAARAAGGTAFELAGWLWKPREGQQWIELATAIAARVGQDYALEADVLHDRIVVTIQLGHPEQALESQDREIASLGRLYGEGSGLLSIAYMNKGVALALMGKPELAMPVFRRAIELFESIGGPDNPQLDLYYGNLGTVLESLRDFDEARKVLLRGLAVQGDQPPGATTVMLLGSLASLELDSEHPAAAIEFVRRGLAAADAIGEGGTQQVPELLYARGMARARLGDAAGAIEDCGRILSMQEAHGGIDVNATYGPDALRCLGEAELSQRRVSLAIEHLERSASLEHRQEPAHLAEARFALARALSEAGRGGARAEALARRARDDLAAMPRREREVAAIDAWLARR